MLDFTDVGPPSQLFMPMGLCLKCMETGFHLIRWCRT